MFSNPLQLAHEYWRQLLGPQDVVVDATCGNGYDTEILSELAGLVHAWDIQEEAIEAVRGKNLENVELRLGCHSQLPDGLDAPIKLGVYNLGYLPGGDKRITTQCKSTLESVNRLLPMVEAGGGLSIMCYPGHPEGEREEDELLSWTRGLPQGEWCVVHHRFVNRRRSPSLLWLHRQGSSSHKVGEARS